jgi:hypothetical protein
MINEIAAQAGYCIFALAIQGMIQRDMQVLQRNKPAFFQVAKSISDALVKQGILSYTHQGGKAISNAGYGIPWAIRQHNKVTARQAGEKRKGVKGSGCCSQSSKKIKL